MTSPKRALALAAVLPLASLAACVQGYSATTGPSNPSGCSSTVVPALALVVRDSVTQKGIASGTLVSGMVSGKQGTYVLSQPLATDSLTIELGTISGTYNVALHRAGYSDVAKNGIVVPSADSLDCHPQTVTVNIAMQPTS